jgi:DNA-binding transcriptional LysR family regulator
MERIEDYEAFIAVVEQGGLTAAARHLGRTLQAVSRSLSSLERSVGVELVRRTTRQSAPTEAGLAFYSRVKPAIAEVADAHLDAASRSTEPSGLLKVGASVLFAPVHLVPIIVAFMECHPRIEVELKLSDTFVDLIEQDLDVAVRIGEMADSALKARRLGLLRRATLAAPVYLARHGRPRHPSELTRHQCVIRTTDRDPYAWPFRINGRPKSIRVGGRLRTNSTASGNAAVACGAGIGNAPLWQVRDLVDSGAVEPILVEYETPPVPIRAVWPGTKMLAAKTRLFVDFLAEHFKSEHL